jgi:two-component system nitrogen regulation response regulator NtrX
MSGVERKDTILVVDDDADIRATLELILQYEGFEVWTARDGAEALARLARERDEGRKPAAVLTDVKMPRLDGLGFLDEVQKLPSPPPVIMVSGHGDVAMAVDAVKRGAVDFIEKPLEQNRVLLSISHALRERSLAAENVGLRRELAERTPLIGNSPAMRTLTEQIRRVAGSDAAVLITGENGSGKEVVARAIHVQSPRVRGAFVTVNCAAIPAELIESELFGHEKGSFTGAHERRVGHFEAASGGSLFLDEICDMPLAAQAKVLRALETHQITRVGVSKSTFVDIRIIAATNADLAQAVEAKTFRLDLFFRLNVVPLRLPPLRERREDIPLLCEHFLAEIAQRNGSPRRSLASDAIAFLIGLDYPGNVRQLRNLLEGACVFAQGSVIGRSDIEQLLAAPSSAAGPPSEGGDPFAAATFEDFKNQSEALFFRRKLGANNGNVKRTAEELGMQRSHLYKKLDRYGLR